MDQTVNGAPAMSIDEYVQNLINESEARLSAQQLELAKDVVELKESQAKLEAKIAEIESAEDPTPKPPEDDDDTPPDIEFPPEPAEPPAAGFTPLAMPTGARVIYVSASDGDDVHDGRSPSDPVKTLARGLSLIRPNFPDWLLLRAGDDFGGQSIVLKIPKGFNYSQRGLATSDTPLVITAYGKGDRPKLAGIKFLGARPVEHAAIVGLRIRGFPALQPSHDILIEDCYIDGSTGGTNVYFKAASGDDPVTDIRIRRNIIVDAWKDKAEGHAQGILAVNTVGLLVEENVIDHNGWHEVASGGDQTMFNHNMYIQYNCRDVTVRGNVIARASANGLQLRSGGVVEDNLFIQNPIGFFISYHRPDGNKNLSLDKAPNPGVAIARRNTILQGLDIGAAAGGIQIAPVASGVYEDNLVLNRLTSHNKPGFDSGPDDNWQHAGNIHVRNNVVQNWSRDDGVGYNFHRDMRPHLTQSGNVLDGRSLETNKPVDQVDPSRDLDAYAEAFGDGGGFDEFIQRVRSRPRGVWDAAWSAKQVSGWIRHGYEPNDPEH